MWKAIRKKNRWYIRDSFLLPKRTFDNPTRLSESDLRAYWKHWYDLSQAGRPFTFKRAGAYDATICSDSDEPQEGGPKENTSEEEEQPTRDREPQEEEEEEVEGQPGEAGAEDEDGHSGSGGKVLTPDQCTSFGEKIIFLRSLVHSDGKAYRDIVNIVAQMRVSFIYAVNTMMHNLTREYPGWWQHRDYRISSQVLLLELDTYLWG
jgi:hypothetical protein